MSRMQLQVGCVPLSLSLLCVAVVMVVVLVCVCAVWCGVVCEVTHAEKPSCVRSKR